MLSYLLRIINCHLASLSFVVICCHLLSFGFAVICCHLASLSFVVNCCHFLSFLKYVKKRLQNSSLTKVKFN
jgi:hypothetical protein